MNSASPPAFSAALSWPSQQDIDVIVRQGGATSSGLGRYVERYGAHAVRQDGGPEATGNGGDDLRVGENRLAGGDR